MSTSSHPLRPEGLRAKRKQLSVEIPDAFQAFFNDAPIKVAYGGRGSGKSFNVAVMLILRAVAAPIRVLCAREFHNSMGESVHKELSAAISLLGLEAFFTITINSIKSHVGAEFFFKGLHMNIAGIKSISNVDICWVEEAHTVSNESWTILMPTIRKAGAEVWITFNPDSEDDPVYQRFVLNPMPGSIIVKANYSDNPFFCETSLVPQLEHCKAMAEKTGDWSEFMNIWEGHPKKISDAMVFRKRFKVEEFETPSNFGRFFFGADWGVRDPTTLVRCFIVGKKLYIDHEAYAREMDMDEIPAMFDKVPDSRKWPMVGDSAQPMIVSYLKRQGFNIRECKKWSGSIVDGVAYLKAFEEIIIHPRCKHTAEEFRLYSHKVIKRTGEILSEDFEDDNNHCIDALRYALDGYITKKDAAKSAQIPFMRR